MAKCDVCGNDYERSFQVVTDKTYTFDSFECAIFKLAPKCEHCGCRIIGHGIESGDDFYCCAHCAHESGVEAAVDNASHATFHSDGGEHSRRNREFERTLKE